MKKKLWKYLSWGLVFLGGVFVYFSIVDRALNGGLTWVIGLVVIPAMLCVMIVKVSTGFRGITKGEAPRLEVRRQKLFAEVFALSSVLGAAVSLWLVYMQFDIDNAEAKKQRVRSLNVTMSAAMCQGSSRMQDCQQLQAGVGALFGQILDDAKSKPGAANDMGLLLAKWAHDDDPQVVQAAKRSKDELDGIAWKESNAKQGVLAALFTVLLITLSNASARKLSVASYEYAEEAGLPKETAVWKLIGHAVKTRQKPC